MAISPLYAATNHVVISLTWTNDSGVAVNLTGATVIARWIPNVGTPFNGAGTLVVTNAAGGLLTYQPNATDTATAGTYQLQFRATYADSTVLDSDPLTITILSAP